MNKETCTWFRDDCGNAWQACGNNEFYLDNENPDEAGMNYCCFCGGKLSWEDDDRQNILKGEDFTNDSWEVNDGQRTDSTSDRQETCRHVPVKPADSEDVAWGNTVLCGKCREVVSAELEQEDNDDLIDESLRANKAETKNERLQENLAMAQHNNLVIDPALRQEGDDG